MRFLIRSILDTINGNNEDFSLHLLKGVPRMFFFFFFFIYSGRVYLKDENHW